MHLAHLALTNFRTFRRLELDLPPGLHLVTSGNALGKTNLLEAIAMLATARSVRGGADADLIAWQALAEDPLPAARLSAQVEGADGSTAVEIAVIARDLQAERPPGPSPDRRVTASRRFRVNGIARRASDLIGRLRVVMFAAEDLRLIDGPPALRRRYLDITISQFDPAYVRALQRYSRVLQQRNSLLRRLQESVRRKAGAADELDFWDGELALAGAVVCTARRQALAALDRGAAARYAELAPTGERLEVCYQPALPSELAASAGEAGFTERLRAAFEEQRDTDIRAGMTRLGPHRDDVTFMLGGARGSGLRVQGGAAKRGARAPPRRGRAVDGAHRRAAGAAAGRHPLGARRGAPRARPRRRVRRRPGHHHVAGRRPARTDGAAGGASLSYRGAAR